MSFRQKLFVFLITPAHFWIAIMAFICGFEYEDNSKFESR